MTSVVGHSRSSISVLTEVSISPQAPWDRPNFTRWRVLPSRPTTWPTRSSCCAMRSLAATISLNVSAILPSRPTWLPAIRTEKSPTRIACIAFRRSCSSGDDPPLRPGTSVGAALGEAPLDLGSPTASLVDCIISSTAHAGRARHQRSPRRGHSMTRVCPPPATATQRLMGTRDTTGRGPWLHLRLGRDGIKGGPSRDNDLPATPGGSTIRASGTLGRPAGPAMNVRPLGGSGANHHLTPPTLGCGVGSGPRQKFCECPDS